MEIINLTTFATIADEQQAEFNGTMCMFVHSRDDDGQPLVFETRRYLSLPDVVETPLNDEEAEIAALAAESNQ